MPPISNELHEDLQRAGEEPGRTSSDRSFGLVFAAFFGLLAIFAWHGNRPSALWLAAAAVILAAVALMLPRVLAWPNWLWQKLGYGLHLIVSPVVLAVMFFGIITPTAAVMRLVGHDPMRRRRDPAAASYWIVRQPPGPAPNSMRHQF